MPTEIKFWSFHKSISKAAKEDLLKHFGATTIQHVGKLGRNDAVLASFKTEADCKYALGKLHQQKLLGVRLKAIYWDSALPLTSQQPHRSQENTEHKDATREEKILKKIKEFEVNLCSMAPVLGINHPVTPSLRYLYPPPSPHIIANIAQTLIDRPKFYTQVLHLMNKMNLPTPFHPVEDLSYLSQYLSEVLGYKASEVAAKSICVEGDSEIIINNNSHVSEHESSESELESEGEVGKSVRPPSVPIKRRIRPQNTIRKKPKLSLLKQTFVSHPRVPEFTLRDVFEAPEAQGARRMQLRLQDTVLPHKKDSIRAASPRQSGIFGKMESVSAETKNPASESMVEWQREADNYITKKEILNGRVSKSEWPILPVFKKYTRGEPSVKLYIKNLAKTTTEEDLKYIFGRYVFWQNEEEAKQFSICLMKEGRMKGQAFVTFPHVEEAAEALEDTNGFILKDKPMVIAFGKIKKQSEDSEAKQ
ncbi:RNA-binding protein 40 [Chionoecetes opilio]|uniref:RNA-binding region-containing protein 3 n=1 Tax=Chionoecetes opilio TaxID=41210 RepID=A0A8J4YY83_CHIOP|nr:RNA-binding protein 40 [Chionoecetes opilio]